MHLSGNDSTQLRTLGRGQEDSFWWEAVQPPRRQDLRIPDSGSHYAISHLFIHVKSFALVFPKSQTQTLPSRILRVLQSCGLI